MKWFNQSRRFYDSAFAVVHVWLCINERVYVFVKEVIIIKEETATEKKEKKKKEKKVQHGVCLAALYSQVALSYAGAF